MVENEQRAAHTAPPESMTPTRGGVKYERMESTKLGPTDMLCPENGDLIDTLVKYADLQRRRGNIELADAYTANANGVIDNVRKFVAPVKTVAEGKRLRLRFIPHSARTDFLERLTEVSSFGTIAELAEDPAITARKLFQTVPGLMHLADDFVLKGHRSIADLLASPEAAQWSEQQLRELRHYEDFRSKVTCQEGVLFSMLVRDYIHDWNRDILFAETGSVRRRELWARENGVRVVISHPDVKAEASQQFLQELCDHLKAKVNGGADWEVWHEGSSSVLLKARIPPVFSATKWRKLVIRFVPHDEWVPQLIDATGHNFFVEKLRARMEEKGWSLTPTSIMNPDRETVVFRTEEELFERIEEPFIPPFDRTEQGPQLSRRNNQFTYQGGEYKEKPRAHRVRNRRGARPTYHELLRRKEAGTVKVDPDFNFSKTHFENGFDTAAYRDRLSQNRPKGRP
eukprot:TRINITY_DN4309_c0_g4_i1.p1 TRINITY_DN4309_c0_g4~~TRINITY_DN4309_c0_g4_i1.p1  ORF type:complete len:519 (+),score=166.89 TRINITY_DN4309_c0_g4_i1:191-1558(+)